MHNRERLQQETPSMKKEEKRSHADVNIARTWRASASGLRPRELAEHAFKLRAFGRR
jgi:hypothetical protein